MGTYAGSYGKLGTRIPDEKKEEFKTRVEMLFQAGGMMETERVSLFGKNVVTIRKASMHEYGMDFNYNYFEDDFWENAGYQADGGYIWSGKTGWRQFYTVVMTAYVLEILYVDGTAIERDKETPETIIADAGWIDYLFQENYTARAVTTQELFHQKDDDMIPYWSSDSDIHFSKELEEWLKELREQFDQIMKEEVKRDNSLKWIIDLMEYADEEYYQIYTFSEFLEETLEHLADRRYLALWEMYDRMLHRPDLEEAGSVIFVPEGEEYEHVGLHYLGEEPRRRLMFTWDMTDMDKRNNKARVTLRRYMALVANQELRKSVFGF